jgi:hypothetical protein
MKLRVLMVAVVWTLAVATAAYGAAAFNQASPFQFDPFKTTLVQGAWLGGIGCPTGATVNDGTTSSTFTAGGCPTGDAADRSSEGLLLAKTGPTGNVASAGAILRNVAGLTLTELGYDLRKPAGPSDARGSHCGAGSPRFNVQTSDAFYFVGCNSPPGTVTYSGNGWVRLRWSTTGGNLMGFNLTTGNLETITGTVSSIAILFDEGQDASPDEFGLAILDNIDVNGTLVGRGPAS